MMRKLPVWLVLFSLAVLLLPLVKDTMAAADKADIERVDFSIRIKGQVTNSEIVSTSVLPGETLSFEMIAPGWSEPFQAKAGKGRLTRVSPRQWQWEAPAEPGTYRIRINHSREDDTVDLNVFVLVPYSRLQGGTLNGYRIGKYPARPLNGNPAYAPPRGFIEVTAKNNGTNVSPHFELKEFVAKQAGNYPRYVVLDERLPVALEAVLERVNQQGIPASKFQIMSGYRTPFYNAAIDNVQYSMHQWGGAADIYIDENRDGRMDDLNRDGVVDKRDAAVLYNLIETLIRQRPDLGIGGLGEYSATSAHGPFVHIDVRKGRARWRH